MSKSSRVTQKRSRVTRKSLRPKPSPAPRGLPPTLRWQGGASGHVVLIDQTLLPQSLKLIRIASVVSMGEAIRSLRVRGAPAIGVAAAYGVVLGAQASRAKSWYELGLDLITAQAFLAASRPTAVNLFWALDRMHSTWKRIVKTAPGGSFDRARVVEELLAEAKAIHTEDAALCEAIGRHGASLLQSGQSILTHCNAGALATGGSGTALSVIYAARKQGKRVRVFSDETRPLLQGARLTCWELQRSGIDVTLICDNMAATVLRSGLVQSVIVGADRIAANGDVANKVGTYGVAVLAREHGVPFYVAAPSTTFDRKLRTGDQIPIEERSSAEITDGFGRSTAPRGIRVFNPAFDVTPARLVTAIITEHGVLRPPFRSSIRKALGSPLTRTRGTRTRARRR